jgi:membrane-associated phospholipid phosphatase
VGWRSRDTDPDDGWTSETASGFALAGFLWVVFVALTLLAIGPLSRFDAAINLDPPPPSWLPVLHFLDRIGQRAVCLPILGAVIFWMWRRTGSWRPALAFFVGGLAYPSGHTSNIVLVYGLAAYLLMRYGRVGTRVRVALWSGVAFLGVLMTFTSLLEHWHWFTDLVAGLLVGGAVLQMTASVDRVVPDVSLARGWRQAAREVVSALDPRTPRGPASRV